ncbi:MAG: asparagine synthase-related protein [Egibacteraceae bacterium]
MLGYGEAWWVVLPDCQAALAVAEMLRPQASEVVFLHSSGRPWLLGRWAVDEMIVAETGRVRVAVAGFCPVTAARLSVLADQVRGIGDLDGLAAKLPGSFHLLASVDGQARVQGSISGLRRVFHTRIGGVTVAADRADVLADLAGATVDERWLAARMLYSSMPHPLTDACPWREVKGLAGDCYLLTDGAGAGRTVRWWSPPNPVVPLTEGAAALRETLSAAVEARTRAGGTISCDLSGGLDSTSLCFLAARGGAHLLTVTFDWSDPGNDDRVWAERAVRELAALGDVECLFLGLEEMPLMYAAVDEAEEGVDVPFAVVRERARFAFIARQLTARGSRLHMGGFGGDAVLHIPGGAYLHTTVRAHPRIALNHLRGHRALRRWPLAATLRGLADHRAYRAWLAAAADGLAAPPPPARGVPPHGWGDPVRLPPWATPQAVDAARGLILEAAQDAQPLAPTRGQHETLGLVRYTGGAVRQLTGVFARAGLRLADPYLDDRVVEACLAVRLHERTTPWTYKPLLVEALRGLVPPTVLERTTKGEFSADGYAGLRRYRAELGGLCEDPIMARLGLVDRDALRAACLGLYPPNLPLSALDGTMACEMWLRRLEQATALPQVPTVIGD